MKSDKRQDIILDKLEEMNEKIFEYGNILDYLKPNAKEILIKYLNQPKILLLGCSLS